ncbi:MAG: hypothetical protein LUG52_07295 [Clostridia bacterium]|nr:hypothetical protein [Clostridia bacterium]
MTKEECIERENDIYRRYQDSIAPFIVELEVRDSEYPIEIFNEIRAIFTHIARYKTVGDENEIISAERHVKRATLDCFKYMCVSIETEIEEFRHSYRNVDLTVANDGKFLPELDKLETNAKASYLAAKKAEIANNISEDELYLLFETAYSDFNKLSAFLEESKGSVVFAQSRFKRSNIINIVAIAVTVISIIITVITLIMSF